MLLVKSGAPWLRCRASPTAATGSSSVSCTGCAKANCNSELTQSWGSGWASQYIGGDGSCVAYDACACNCYGSSGTGDQLLDVRHELRAPTRLHLLAAINASTKCIDDRCMTACR